jgi:hypothetical protein
VRGVSDGRQLHDDGRGEDRRRRWRTPNPAITIIAALAGSGTPDADTGTLKVGKETPLAAAKVSKAATSPAEAAPLSPWL